MNRTGRLVLVLGVMGAAAFRGGAAQAAPPPPAYKIIVHPANPVTELTRADVAAYFLKRRFAWSTGLAVAPVDLPADTDVRRRFSQDILGRPPKAVASFWIQEIFAGRAVPPPVKSTPTAVVAYVTATPGAIGYVPADTPTTAVRVVRVTP
jgi:ABC-type phosphate transport system substrate-binding protein